MIRLLTAVVVVLVVARLCSAQGIAASATPVSQIKALKGFQVELLYSVPKAEQGSWVNMCVGPNGTLIVSDQDGSLYRVKVPEIGTDALPQVTKIPAEIGYAQGLLWAFDSLYVVVNSPKMKTGLYRVRDTDGDSELDDVKLLRAFDGKRIGEHGPHALLLAPDGKSLRVVCGNQTALTEFSKSRVPTVWGEDHLLPRMPDGNGFMAGILGPGGAIYAVDPEGKDWELLSVGYRNQYDAAFNKYGDLFTYDADMEWDVNTPWYRPTRVCLAASGSEFGWRNGAGKWPAYYPDSWPAVVDIGPGSPTGVTFGYGAKFPAKYQEAFFICDWSYGKLYAVHLEPEGSAYKGTFEEFVSGTPLPLTDVVIRPEDGAMYFTIGGRGTQSGLYRVTYTGANPSPPAPLPQGERGERAGAEARALRAKLESFHGKPDPAAVAAAWPYLSSPDRYIRSAARVAIEHQPVAAWKEKALAETNPVASIQALLALVRVSGYDPAHRPPSTPPADEALRGQILAALDRIEWKMLTDPQRLDLLRVYAVLLNRLAPATEAERKQLTAKLNVLYPAKNRFLNAELCNLLVYLEAPGVATKTLALLGGAPTQEEQMEYARALRVLKASNWTLPERDKYFNWFLKAANYKGGNSLQGFFKIMRDDAIATLTPDEKTALQTLLNVNPETQAASIQPPRPFVKKWTLEEVVPLVEKGLTKRDFERGRRLFGAANCFACHRFAGEGGSNGPDLTALAGRFSTKDLLESVVEPSKVISDQYASVVLRLADGRTVTGRIVNLQRDLLHVNTDMLNPNGLEKIPREEIEELRPSTLSMMPAGLLDTLNEEEVKDLLAFLLSRGDPENAMFQ